MREIPEALQAHLDGGVTTLARCWRLTLADGEVRGFTEHDRDLVFDGVTYKAATGLTGSAIEGRTGLSVGDQEVAGVLSDDGIDAGELEAGLYDGAEVATFLVNWCHVDQRVMLSRAEIGEVEHQGESFRAELRSRAARLNVPVGRTYQPMCDAVLGDTRCGVDLMDPDYRGAGTVFAAAEGRLLTVDGLLGFDEGWFAGGSLLWTSGANAGLRGEVRASANGVVELWRAAPRAIAPGDGFTVTAGCDKRFVTCGAKFANRLNFRGHPHMPGNDWVTAYPADGDRLDGSSLNR